MDELITKLRSMMSNVVKTMAVELATGEGWAAWLGVLAQTQVAIRAVEAIQAAEAEGSKE